MRTEKEIYKLLFDIANSDNDILAIYQNGSRVNEHAKKDIFQDYDIVFVVSDTHKYINNKSWINKFGKILYMQYPDEFPNTKPDNSSFYGFLVQFKDGIRIDLHVETVEHAQNFIKTDSLCKILLDKNNILPLTDAPNDSRYWTSKPSQDDFSLVCNEFWWCSNNVAKGIWRDEIVYAHDMANILREQLKTMLSWKASLSTNFSINIGKSGKYLYKYLEKDDWQTYLDTFFDSKIENAINAMQKMIEFFFKLSLFVSEELGFLYNYAEAKNARDYFLHVIKLPKNATEIY